MVLVDSNVILDILGEALPSDMFERHPLPWEAAFLAGKCFLGYRWAGGIRRSPLPDFFIGAHASVQGMSLLMHFKSVSRLLVVIFSCYAFLGPTVFKVTLYR